jgi:hypothetical protein
MTLENTSLYDSWINHLQEAGDVDEGTAQQIVDIIIGDPRIAFEHVRTDSEVESLRDSLEQAIDEFDLTAYGNVSDHEKMRTNLLLEFDSKFKTKSDSGEGEENSTSAAFSSESEEYDREDESIYMEVGETNIDLEGAAVAGGEGDPANEDIDPRDSDLDDDEIWQSDAKENPKQDNSSQADNNTTTPSLDDNSSEPAKNENGEDELPLSVVITNFLIEANERELNESLTPPLEVVSDDMLKFGHQTVFFYRTLVRDALFPQYEDEEEREQMFRNLVESRVQAQLDYIMSADSNENDGTDETNSN